MYLWVAASHTRLMQEYRFFAKPDLADNIKYNLKNVFKIYVS